MRFTWWQYVTWSGKLANSYPGTWQHPVKMLPFTCMVMSSATPIWVYFRQYIVLNGKEDIQDYVEIKLPSSNNNASCVVSSAIILFVFITSAILISSVGRLVWGRCREASRQKYVRRRERQNVTVGGQPAAPLETFWSEVLVVEVLGHFLQVLHVGSVG